jgi:hypothetical protein
MLLTGSFVQNSGNKLSMNEFLSHKRCFIPSFVPGVTPLPAGIPTMPVKAACRDIIYGKLLSWMGYAAS